MSHIDNTINTNKNQNLAHHRTDSGESIVISLAGQEYRVSASHGQGRRLAKEDYQLSQRTTGQVISDGVKYTIRKICQTNVVKPIFTGFDYLNDLYHGTKNDKLMHKILERRFHELAKQNSRLESFSAADYMEKVETLQFGNLKEWFNHNQALRNIEMKFSQVFISCGRCWHTSTDTENLDRKIHEELSNFVHSITREDRQRLQESCQEATRFFDVEAINQQGHGILTPRILLMKFILKMESCSNFTLDSTHLMADCQKTLVFYETISTYSVLSEFQKIYHEHPESLTAIEKFKEFLDYINRIGIQYVTKIYIALIMMTLISRNISGAAKTEDFNHHLKDRYSNVLNAAQIQNLTDYADNLFRTIKITDSMQKFGNIALSGIAAFMYLTSLTANFLQQIVPDITDKHDSDDVVGSMWRQILKNYSGKVSSSPPACVSSPSIEDKAVVKSDHKARQNEDELAKVLPEKCHQDELVQGILEKIIADIPVNEEGSGRVAKVAGYLMTAIRGANTLALELKEAFPDTKRKSEIYKAFLAMIIPGANIENKAVMDEVTSFTRERQLAEICAKLVIEGEVSEADLDFLKGISGDQKSQAGKRIAFNKRLTNIMLIGNALMLATDLVLSYGYPDRQKELMESGGGLFNYVYSLGVRPLLMAMNMGVAYWVTQGGMLTHARDVGKNMLARLIASAPAILFWRKSDTASNTVGAAIDTIGSTAPEQDTHVAFTKLFLESELVKIQTLLQIYGSEEWEQLESQIPERLDLPVPTDESSWDEYLDQRRHRVVEIAQAYRETAIRDL